MTSTLPATRSLRRRFFGSHMIVMVVAVAVLAVVVSVVELLGEGRALDFDRRGGGGGPSTALLGLSAAAIASGLVSWRLTKRLTQPLDAIGAAARDLAA